MICWVLKSCPAPPLGLLAAVDGAPIRCGVWEQHSTYSSLLTNMYLQHMQVYTRHPAQLAMFDSLPDMQSHCKGLCVWDLHMAGDCVLPLDAQLKHEAQPVCLAVCSVLVPRSIPAVQVRHPARSAPKCAAGCPAATLQLQTQSGRHSPAAKSAGASRYCQSPHWLAPHQATAPDPQRAQL